MRSLAIALVVFFVAFAQIGRGQTALHNAVMQDDTRITAQGNPAPGGGTYSTFNNVQANGGGDVAFIATIQGTGGTPGVFEITSGVHSAVARSGQTAPNPPGTYLSFDALDLSDAGTVAFRSTIQRAIVRTAVLTDVGGVTTVVAEQAQPVPGMAGTVYNIPGPPSINDSGNVAFASTLLNPSGAAVFLAAGGPPAAVVSAGEATPIGGTYSGFTTVALDDSDGVWFHANVSGGSAPSAIFVSQAGVESLVVAEGDATPAGGTFSSFGAFSVNTAGQLAFQATISAVSTPSGVFLREPGGSIAALALQTGAAPGTGGGEFSSMAPGISLAAPSLNDAGDVAFGAEILGGTTSSGMFRVPSGGALEAVAVRNTAVPSVPATVFYTISAAPEVDDAGVASFRAQLFSNNDADGDGYVVLEDNCVLHANPTQCDVDFDDYGDHCDGDFDQNGTVAAVDFMVYFVPDFKAGVDQFDLGTDMDCNGAVNAIDFNVNFVPQFKRAGAGPSGLHCGGIVPCDL